LRNVRFLITASLHFTDRSKGPMLHCSTVYVLHIASLLDDVMQFI